MSKISLKVNGKLYTVELEPGTPLLFALSDEIGLRGPKFGCGMAQCGACTVILRGQVVRSCVMSLSAVGQDEVTMPESEFLAKVKEWASNGAACPSESSTPQPTSGAQ